MNNGTLCNNNYGCVNNKGEFIMNGGSIYGNKVSETYYGAVYNDGIFTMENGSISENTLNEYLDDLKKLNIILIDKYKKTKKSIYFGLIYT